MEKTTFIIRNEHDRAEGVALVSALGFPGRYRLELTPVREARSMVLHDKLYAHLRDIARHRYGAMTAPDRVVEIVKEDFKRTDIWPRYSDPEPDTFTGEVLYRAKSVAHMDDAEKKGVIQWLEYYMGEKKIPSHAPTDRWSDPAEAA